MLITYSRVPPPNRDNPNKIIQFRYIREVFFGEREHGFTLQVLPTKRIFVVSRVYRVYFTRTYIFTCMLSLLL